MEHRARVGVEYHVLVTCEGGNRCFGGSTRAAWTIHRADRATSTKYNWQADIRLDATLTGRILTILRNSGSRVPLGERAAAAAATASSRVAPFALNCSRVAGAWREDSVRQLAVPFGRDLNSNSARTTSWLKPTVVGRTGSAVSAGAPSGQGSSGQQSQSACSWASGCCRRHPKIPSCVREYETLSDAKIITH